METTNRVFGEDQEVSVDYVPNDTKQFEATVVVSNTRRRQWARKEFLSDVNAIFGGVTITQVTGYWSEAEASGEEEGERFSVLGEGFEDAESFFALARTFAGAIGEIALAQTIQESLWSIEFTAIPEEDRDEEDAEDEDDGFIL